MSIDRIKNFLTSWKDGVIEIGRVYLEGGDYEKYADKLEELKLVIIDEVSMMDVQLLYQIHQKLCHIMDKPEDVLFGGVSVILFGDLLQVIYYYKTEKFEQFHQSFFLA